jgi:hypothetical protein
VIVNELGLKHASVNSKEEFHIKLVVIEANHAHSTMTVSNLDTI